MKHLNPLNKDPQGITKVDKKMVSDLDLQRHLFSCI